MIAISLDCMSVTQAMDSYMDQFCNQLFSPSDVCNSAFLFLGISTTVGVNGSAYVKSTNQFISDNAEPIPRERVINLFVKQNANTNFNYLNLQVFDMMIFPEYADKITLAFLEMLPEPEAWSVMADFLAEWAESKDGPVVFSEACIRVSTTRDGQKV